MCCRDGELLAEPDCALKVRQEDRDFLAICVVISARPLWPVYAKDAECTISTRKNGTNHVMNIKFAQPFLIEAAFALFDRRDKIMIGDNARDSETCGAFHP